MTLTNTLIGICWFILIVVWLITAVGAKKSKENPKGKAGRWISLLLVVCFLICTRVKEVRVLNEHHLFFPNYLVQVLSVVFCISGISFAIWARLHMGKNWGMPMALKEHTELITSGPYRLIRHPIYAGLSLAMIGSMLIGSILMAIWCSLLIWFFLYSALKEEKTMSTQFPDEYPMYRKRTKMLIPFVL
jgi:protein-S-isoprenylcysteine O-methyltransferase Ste14